MSLVLDCSTTLAWIYPDESTDVVRGVFDTIEAEGAFAPALWHLEVANGLTLAVRRRRVTVAFRAEALNVLRLLPIAIDPETSAYAWTSSLQIADRFGLTVYDAVYVELAQRRSLPLATLDGPMQRAGRGVGLEVIGG